MSNTLLTLAWKVPLPAMEKLVLVRLADFADDDKGGECWPSVARLSTETGIHRRTVFRCLAALERAGHITLVRARGTSSRYRVHPCHSVTPSGDNPCHSVTTPHDTVAQGGDTVAQDPCHSATQTIIEPSEEPSEEPSLHARVSSPTAIVVRNPEWNPENVSTLWNAFAGRVGLPVLRGVSGERLAALRKNLAEHDMDDWREAFSAISRSNFLLGKVNPDFRATFDWLLKPGNFAKVIEGNFKADRTAGGDAVTRAIRESSWGATANRGSFDDLLSEISL